MEESKSKEWLAEWIKHTQIEYLSSTYYSKGIPDSLKGGSEV
nr:hypothetical protein LKV13_04610 [Borrelia sp. BU AG58]